MLHWVEVLHRILSLYKVRTQQELAMAMGVPVNFGMDGQSEESGIPWPILAIVVKEKNVSWDWLLTGREYQGRKHAAEEERSSAATAIDASRTPSRNPPRIETRELARQLLPPRGGSRGPTLDALPSGGLDIDDESPGSEIRRQ